MEAESLTGQVELRKVQQKKYTKDTQSKGGHERTTGGCITQATSMVTMVAHAWRVNSFELEDENQNSSWPTILTSHLHYSRPILLYVYMATQTARFFASLMPIAQFITLSSPQKRKEEASVTPVSLHLFGRTDGQICGEEGRGTLVAGAVGIAGL